MDFTIELVKDQKIVFAVAKGEWDSTTDNSMIYKVMEMVDETGAQMVLLDIRGLSFNFPIVQVFERAKEMREQRRQFGKVSAKAAIVFTPEPKTEQDMKFFENAARNRGLPYRTFNDFENAMAWLTGESV